MVCWLMAIPVHEAPSQDLFFPGLRFFQIFKDFFPHLGAIAFFPHEGLSNQRRNGKGGSFSVNKVTKYFIPESQLALAQPFRVERPQNTWIRCFLPYLKGIVATYLDSIKHELTKQPPKSPCKSHVRQEVRPKILFLGKNICPTFQSLMPKIPPVKIFIAVLKNWVYKPGVWDCVFGLLWQSLNLLDPISHLSNWINNAVF